MPRVLSAALCQGEPGEPLLGVCLCVGLCEVHGTEVVPEVTHFMYSSFSISFTFYCVSVCVRERVRVRVQHGFFCVCVYVRG